MIITAHMRMIRMIRSEMLDLIAKIGNPFCGIVMRIAAKENALSAANFNSKAKRLHLFILNYVGHSVNWYCQSSTLVRIGSIVSELMVR